MGRFSYVTREEVGPMEALEYARMMITLSSKIVDTDPPGSLIASMSSKYRKALESLTSDMTTKQRLDDWELKELGESPWLTEEKQKLIEDMHKHGNEI